MLPSLRETHQNYFSPRLPKAVDGSEMMTSKNASGDDSSATGREVKKPKSSVLNGRSVDLQLHCACLLFSD